MAYQVQNKPSAAYWLSMIGGIIGILASIGFFVLGVFAYLAVGALGDYGYYYDYGAIGWGFTFYFALGVWCIITSTLVIVFAKKLMADPLAHGKWGALILIFSIIGLGTLFGFIGGILAIVYKPIPVGAAPQYQAQQPYYGPQPQQVAYQPPPQMRVCPQCGTQMQGTVRFCPNCGRQQY